MELIRLGVILLSKLSHSLHSKSAIHCMVTACLLSIHNIFINVKIKITLYQ